MNEPVKALTVLQPWAQLLAMGVKMFETRSWKTAYRGKLVIHAGKTPPQIDQLDKAFIHALGASGLKLDNIPKLPLGAAVCVCDLVGVWRAESVAAQFGLDRRIPPYEEHFGNFAPGRYAWQIANVRIFETPIPARGAQQLWDWTLPLPEPDPDSVPF